MSDIEYPLSRVVKGIKKHTGDKQVSLKVKMATEQLLQDITELVSKDLERTTKPNKTITEEDLRLCTRPFEFAIHVEEEHEEIVKSLENMRDRIGQLTKDFRHKFDMKENKSEHYWQ